MPRRRTRLNWLYDNDLQQFTTPSGQVVTLLQIAQLLQNQVNCSHDFAGAWTGWRIRQNRLIAPGQTFKGSQITPNNLRAFSRWLRSFEGEQAQLEFHSSNNAHSHRPAPIPSGFPNTADHHDKTSYQPSAHTAPGDGEPTREPRRRAQVIQLSAYRKLAQ